MQPDAQPPIAPSETPESQQLLGYDASGQPLYGTPAPQHSSLDAAPNLGSAFQAQRTAPVAREPMVPRGPRRSDSPRSEAVRADVKEKHDASVRDHPNIDLTDTEYVIMVVKRHQIGILAPLFGGLLLICLVIAGIIVYPSIINETMTTDAPSTGVVALIGILLSAIIASFTYLSYWLYRANQLALTNESLVRTVQTSLFAKKVRTVSLGDVGGVSYKQTGILQTMLGYGTVHVNTRGNDVIYQMSYAIKPRVQVTTIEKAVEEFKERFGVDHRF